MPLSLSTDK